MAQRISRRQIAKGLVRLLSEQPTRRQEIIRQAAAYLVATKQTATAHLLMQDIADELLSQGHMAAAVRTAVPLDTATRQAITAMLKRTSGATSVELSEEVDSTLVGGVIIRTPRHEMDTSIRAQLTRIAGGIQ